jgi:hypothetical protein
VGTPVRTDGVAVAALVLSILGLTVAAVPLALASLLRRRGGIHRGKALATAALAVSAMWVLAAGGAAAVVIPPQQQGTVLAVGTPAPSAKSSTAPATPSPAAETTAGPAPVDVQEIQEGDCLNSQHASTVETVPRVPCTKPHDEEVIALRDLARGRWPGDKAIERRGDQLCSAAFTSFVGIPFDRSRLDLSWYTPTKEGWNLGDHTVVCTVSDPGGKTAGTLRGSRR